MFNYLYYRKETFEVNIKKCRDLAIADVKRKKTDPLVISCINR